MELPVPEYQATAVKSGLPAHPVKSSWRNLIERLLARHLGLNLYRAKQIGFTARRVSHYLLTTRYDAAKQAAIIEVLAEGLPPAVVAERNGWDTDTFDDIIAKVRADLTALDGKKISFPLYRLYEVCFGKADPCAYAKNLIGAFCRTPDGKIGQVVGHDNPTHRYRIRIFESGKIIYVPAATVGPQWKFFKDRDCTAPWIAPANR